MFSSVVLALNHLLVVCLAVDVLADTVTAGPRTEKAVADRSINWLLAAKRNPMVQNLRATEIILLKRRFFNFSLYCPWPARELMYWESESLERWRHLNVDPDLFVLCQRVSSSARYVRFGVSRFEATEFKL